MMAGKSRLMSNLPILTPELFFSILYYVNTTVNTIESASITYTLNGQVRKTVQGKSSSSGHSLPLQLRTACSSARAAFFVFASSGKKKLRSCLRICASAFSTVFGGLERRTACDDLRGPVRLIALISTGPSTPVHCEKVCGSTEAGVVKSARSA
jgi:hypothetical protein